MKVMVLLKIMKKLFIGLSRPLYKDCIAVNGISLTVAKVIPETESVVIALIPHTIKKTLFATMSEGQKVNIELNVKTLQRDHPDNNGNEGSQDVRFMRKAIEEGEKGRYTAAPNTCVGAVLVDPWGTPYVVCKLGLSQDNCFAYTTDTRIKREWITGEHARKHSHGLRARSQRIVVGKNTHELDNPKLTVRYGIDVDTQPETCMSTRALNWLKPNDDSCVQVLVEGGPELEDDLMRRNLVNEFVLYRSS